MKRYISIFLIISLCFSFAACSAKEETPQVSVTEEPTTVIPPPETVTEEYSREFTDENGRVVYTVKAQLPKIIGNVSESIANDINRSVYGIFEDACETAENNIENAAKFMDSQNLETPWAKTFEYDVNLCSGKYFSFTVKEYFTMYGVDNTEPAVKGYTFDVVRGKLSLFMDFTYENDSYENVRQVIIDEFICRDVSADYYNGAELPEEQRNSVFAGFDAENFYLTDDGIGFYFSENVIDPLKFGTFVAHYTWEEIAVILKRP